jgi:uncharacterized phage infection (PIP) family protein YhgE
MVDINKTLTQVALLLHELGGTGAREKYSRAAEAVDLVLQAIAPLDANRHRLIEIINSNLDERDEARAQVTVLQARLKLSQENVASEADAVAALTAENAVLRGVLRDAQQKLRLYRDALGGEYLGGVEYTVLEKRITAALTEGEKK